MTLAEDTGFEPVRGVAPTRFPIVRPRPLGESSAANPTGRVWSRPNHVLGRLLERAESDQGFYAELVERCRARRPRFSREGETSAWAVLLDDVMRAGGPDNRSVS